MPSPPTEMDIEQLSVPQRLELIARLWDSIPDTAEALPVPEWHRQELERRLATADADPAAAIPWEQVKAQLRERQDRRGNP
jgi:putative addiction module component (TIGR02574 family)